MSYLIIPLALEFLEQQEVAVVEEQIFEELQLVVEQLFVGQVQVLEQLAEEQQLAAVVEQTFVEPEQTVVG